ncbi:MAG: hypothetical protein PG981_000184 [Wolbachia endosymbiont of Ctenocephalides orientis wCori]|nr:MAG: hypothetical protein PG981_000184 [Wolbachia endosymbiont of Ctenocephalides orientis wCori]
MAVNIVWSCSSYLDKKLYKEDFESEPQQNIDNPDKDNNPDKGHFCNLITELRVPSAESRAI